MISSIRYSRTGTRLLHKLQTTVILAITRCPELVTIYFLLVTINESCPRQGYFVEVFLAARVQPTNRDRYQMRFDWLPSATPILIEDTPHYCQGIPMFSPELTSHSVQVHT